MTKLQEQRSALGIPLSVITILTFDLLQWNEEQSAGGYSSQDQTSKYVVQPLYSAEQVYS